MTENRLTRLLRLPVLILDFDGPICGVYAGLPDHVVTQRLRAVLARNGVDVSEEIQLAHDPLEVLRYTASVRRDLVPEVDAELTRAEIEAMQTATLTPHIRDVLDQADLGRTGIVSNNSAAAIGVFFERHDLGTANGAAHPA